MGLRGRREERREERQDFGPGGGATQYQMREKMFAIGDDFWVERGGEKAFKVDGKALRMRQTLKLESPGGDELLTIQEKKLSVRDKMDIEKDGNTLASVKKAMVGIRDRYSIEVKDGEDLSAMGNFVDHEFEIERDGKKIAEVSKKWFRIRDSYGIEVSPGENDALIVGIAICIDQMARG